MRIEPSDRSLQATLETGINILKEFQIAGARTSASLLLAHSLGLRTKKLDLSNERQVTDAEYALFQRCLRRRIQGEPITYIRGYTDFLGMEIQIDSSVVIPRQDSKLVVLRSIDVALNLSAEPGTGSLRVVDCGTGSGCIALALSQGIPGATVYACDISKDALLTARINADHLHMSDRIRFVQADLLECFADDSFDLLVCNPPYVKSSEEAPREVQKEPAVGIFGGDDGLKYYRRLVPAAKRVLRPGGWTIVELSDMPDPERLFPTTDWDSVEVYLDAEGLQLAVLARRRINTPVAAPPSLESGTVPRRPVR